MRDLWEIIRRKKPRQLLSRAKFECQDAHQAKLFKEERIVFI